MSRTPSSKLTEQVVDRGGRLVAVALGTVLGGIALGREKVRTLPESAQALPTTVLTGAVSAVDKVRHEGVHLALRGLGTVLKLREKALEVPGAVPYPGTRPTAVPAASPTPEPAPAPPSPVLSAEAAEVVAETLTTATATAPSHDELPLADYDHLTLGSLRGRLRALSIDDLLALRAYETSHADRLPIVTMFDNRLAKLRAVQ